ncbi:MAG TPA: hypothetical protein DF427_02200 [Moraxellaceae bacterium]|nr:hypothetical protein [Moraxellaceae bacterium]
MTDQRASQPFYTGRMYRLLTAAFGLLLTGVGLYPIFYADTSAVARIAGGSALFLAGYDLISAACKARESWLSRLGPLP